MDPVPVQRQQRSDLARRHPTSTSRIVWKYQGTTSHFVGNSYAVILSAPRFTRFVLNRDVSRADALINNLESVDSGDVDQALNTLATATLGATHAERRDFFMSIVAAIVSRTPDTVSGEIVPDRDERPRVAATATTVTTAATATNREPSLLDACHMIERALLRNSDIQLTASLGVFKSARERGDVRLTATHGTNNIHSTVITAFKYVGTKIETTLATKDRAKIRAILNTFWRERTRSFHDVLATLETLGPRDVEADEATLKEACREVETALGARDVARVRGALDTFQRVCTLIHGDLDILYDSYDGFVDASAIGMWRMVSRQFREMLASTRILLSAALCVLTLEDVTWCYLDHITRVCSDMEKVATGKLDFYAFTGRLGNAGKSQVMGAVLANGIHFPRSDTPDTAQHNIVTHARLLLHESTRTKGAIYVEWDLKPFPGATSDDIVDDYKRVDLVYHGQALTRDQLTNVHTNTLSIMRDSKVVVMYRTPRDFRAAYANEDWKFAYGHLLDMADIMRNWKAKHVHTCFGAYVCSLLPTIASLVTGEDVPWLKAMKLFHKVVGAFKLTSVKEAAEAMCGVTGTLATDSVYPVSEFAQDWLEFDMVSERELKFFPRRYFVDSALGENYVKGLRPNVVPAVRALWRKRCTSEEAFDGDDAQVDTVISPKKRYTNAADDWSRLVSAASEYSTSTVTFPRKMTKQTAASLAGMAATYAINNDWMPEDADTIEGFLSQGVYSSDVPTVMARWATHVFNPSYEIEGTEDTGVVNFLREIDRQIAEHACIRLARAEDVPRVRHGVLAHARRGIYEDDTDGNIRIPYSM